MNIQQADDDMTMVWTELNFFFFCVLNFFTFTSWYMNNKGQRSFIETFINVAMHRNIEFN